MPEAPEERARALWQSEAVAGVRISPERIRSESRQFERTIRRRNAREYVTASFLTIFFGHLAWRAAPWSAKIGPALIALGNVYVALQLATRAGARAFSGAEPCLVFHRRELERQRDALRGVWRWYLGPLVPGLVAFLGPLLVEGWKTGGRPFYAALVATALCALVFGAIGALNARAAKRLDAELSALAGDES